MSTEGEYKEDLDWEYGFCCDGLTDPDGKPLVQARVFGILPFTSLASAKHTGVKWFTESIEYYRHPKGSQRNDDWEVVS